MRNILHDISVAWWAYRSQHHNYKEFRIGIIWPISVRRAQRLEIAWTVALHRPAVFILNDLAVERDYYRTHSQPSFTRLHH